MHSRLFVNDIVRPFAIFSYARVQILTGPKITPRCFSTEKILKRWDDRDSFLHMARRIESCRFRGFLSHVLWRFLQDQWGKEKAVTTGGQTAHVSLSDPELHADEIIPGTYEVFGREFDRVFALEVIRKAANHSKHSKFHMAHLRREITQAEAAKELGMRRKHSSRRITASGSGSPAIYGTKFANWSGRMKTKFALKSNI